MLRFNRNLNLLFFFRYQLHYGSFYKNWNSEISAFVIGLKNHFYLFNIKWVLILLRKSLYFSWFLGFNLKKICYVVDNEATNLIKFFFYKTALKCHSFYSLSKWFQGALTNIRELKYKRNIRVQKSMPGFSFKEIPASIFVSNLVKPVLFNVMKEAYLVGIPVLSFIFSNSNNKGVDYPMIVNNDKPFINFFVLEVFKKTYLTGFYNRILFLKKKITKMNLKFLCLGFLSKKIKKNNNLNFLNQNIHVISYIYLFKNLYFYFSLLLYLIFNLYLQKFLINFFCRIIILIKNFLNNVMV